ncbi:MAG: hypothetical protein L0H14_11895 [Yaniella sp.]|uniref:hypothetical protein n=1 Tax=Yaniella sp. TaxID=2773929 RepID=UPI0026491EFB|nr:hypothetical protein [Yaniella sp.]MDN5732507.1 hypothetical protein [Yaniella sp.]
MMNSTNPDLRLPMGALIIAGMAVVFMVIWSVALWPDMTPTIVTREAGGNHGQSAVSREVTAAAMPVVLVVLAVLLAAAPTLDAKLMRLIITTPQQDRGRGSPRVLGASLVGLSILLSALHVGFVDMHTGAGLPIEQIVPVAAGVLLTILGIYLPLAHPSTTHDNERFEAFRAAQGPAYRIGGFVLVLVGLATIVSGLLLPWLSIVIAVGGVAAIFVSIIVVSLIRASQT